MKNKLELLDQSNREHEVFFIKNDREITKIVNKLIDFRIDIKADQKREIKLFFNAIKKQALSLGYENLSELGRYYEDYIEQQKNIKDNSHHVFSEILKGVANIKKEMEKLRNSNNDFDFKKAKIQLKKQSRQNNILLLDDDRLISAILKDAFREEGYNITTTTNHQEAIEQILYGDVDIALIDIIMPKMNGFEVLDILKRNGVDIPIIFLSGKSFLHYKIDALSRGVDDYITKPFEIKEVIARVERSLGRADQYKNKINKDELTCAYTKQYFNETMEDIINKKRHLKNDFSVAFLDLDDFKYINDNHGHVIGDYALRDFAKFLEDNLEENDKLFRFGGDEFIVLFQEKSMDKAYRDIESLRKKLAKTNFKYDDIEENLRLSISIGITSANEFDDVERILNRADKCLYKSKKLGKNKTISSDYI